MVPGHRTAPGDRTASVQFSEGFGNLAGYDYSLGLAGSVLGNDHFSAMLREDKGGTGTYAKTRQFALHYRFFF